MIQIYKDKVNIYETAIINLAQCNLALIYIYNILNAAYLYCSTVMRMSTHRDEPKEINSIALIISAQIGGIHML